MSVVDHEWLFGDDTGLSSMCLFRTMSGIPEPADRWKRGQHPHDPADLGRCIRLLERHPEWVPRLAEMAVHGPVWEALVARWDELVASYQKETGGQRYGRTAKATYDLMRSIIDPAEKRRRRPA